MAMITVAIPTVGGQTIGVLAERITTHLAIHPGLLISFGGATDYDQSALELTHILTGAMVCQISDSLTVRPGAVGGFARWLETACPLAELAYHAIRKGLPQGVRAQIRRFVDSPNDWRPPECCAHTARQLPVTGRAGEPRVVAATPVPSAEFVR